MEKLCWITGTGGLIGSHIVRAAPPEWRVIALTREQLDIRDFDAVRARFSAERPQLVIHCAAMAKVNECESHPQLAWLVNCEATRVLAELSASIPLLFFSTDLVFDGRKGNYVERDAPNPLTRYAATKVAAEEVVLANPRHTVVRTSLNGGASPGGDRSFTEQLLNSWRAGRATRLFTDEFRSPIMAEATARAVWELVAQGGTGLLHVAGSERLSRYEIGEIVARKAPELKPVLERASLRDFDGPPRAPDTSLDSSRAQELLSFPLPSLSDWMKSGVPA
ncbi:MAG TPA: NAD(P)-dependent oxidoreductase [Candidatus Acidoferrum sp.]|nr:NAD(P)-dependent oxidoreductase [Candidatus Acidoferrum sp.]